MVDITTTCRDIAELTPSAQKACNLFMAECKRQGLNVLITETYRSQERQNYLYSLGRTRTGNKVTWTKNSRHTSRRAWDICKNVKGEEYSDSGFFKACGEIAKRFNITWGGDWETPDTPHFEISADWSYNESEDIDMDELNKLKAEVAELQEELKKVNKVYNYIVELPDWAKPTILKLYEKGIIKGVGEDKLDLTMPMIRMFVVNDKAGLYD